jgi:hypothetical protein
MRRWLAFLWWLLLAVLCWILIVGTVKASTPSCGAFGVAIRKICILGAIEADIPANQESFSICNASVEAGEKDCQASGLPDGIGCWDAAKRAARLVGSVCRAESEGTLSCAAWELGVQAIFDCRAERKDSDG